MPTRFFRILSTTLPKSLEKILLPPRSGAENIRKLLLHGMISCKLTKTNYIVPIPFSTVMDGASVNGASANN